MNRVGYLFRVAACLILLSPSARGAQIPLEAGRRLSGEAAESQPCNQCYSPATEQQTVQPVQTIPVIAVPSPQQVVQPIPVSSPPPATQEVQPIVVVQPIIVRQAPPPPAEVVQPKKEKCPPPPQEVAQPVEVQQVQPQIVYASPSPPCATCCATCGGPVEASASAESSSSASATVSVGNRKVKAGKEN